MDYIGLTRSLYFFFCVLELWFECGHEKKKRGEKQGFFDTFFCVPGIPEYKPENPKTEKKVDPQKKKIDQLTHFKEKFGL